MTFELFAFLSKQVNSNIKELIKLDLDARNAKGKGKKNIEKEAEVIRERLINADPNLHLCYHGLAVSSKEDSADKLRSTWAKKNISVILTEPTWNTIREIKIPTFDFSILPQFSFAIQFTFKLAKPYISKDEQEFYIIDNPIRKDKVFGLPYVAPSSWKGSLRSALWRLDHEDKEEQIVRIFGNKRGEEDESMLRKGQLHFYPTFFTMRSLEVINPHDRAKRFGLRPIYFESVPVDAEGTFSLLYIPFDLLGSDKITARNRIASDLKLISEGLQDMFTVYGFGAKTSSGFGSARPDLTDGKIILRAEGIETGQKEEMKLQLPEESFKKYLKEDGSAKENFKGSGEVGLLSNSEYKEKGEGGSLSEFKQFRRWYGQCSEQWQKHIQIQKSPRPKWPTWTFDSFSDLLKRADEIKGLLAQEGG